MVNLPSFLDSRLSVTNYCSANAGQRRWHLPLICHAVILSVAQQMVILVSLSNVRSFRVIAATSYYAMNTEVKMVELGRYHV